MSKYIRFISKRAYDAKYLDGWQYVYGWTCDTMNDHLHSARWAAVICVWWHGRN